MVFNSFKTNGWFKERFRRIQKQTRNYFLKNFSLNMDKNKLICIKANIKEQWIIDNVAKMNYTIKKGVMDLEKSYILLLY